MRALLLIPALASLAAPARADAPDKPAATAAPADKPERTGLGQVTGVVQKVTGSEVTVRVSGVVAVPSSRGSRGRSSARPTARRRGGAGAQAKEVHEDVTYTFASDVKVSLTGAAKAAAKPASPGAAKPADPAPALDLRAGDTVTVHLMREITRPAGGGSPSAVETVATRVEVSARK